MMHVWKRHWEGAGYAVAEYPCQYIEASELVALTPAEASRHAAEVCGSHHAMVDRLGEQEHDRLYDLARVEGRRVIESRHPWGVRWQNGNVSAFESEGSARWHCYEPSWCGVHLLRRYEPGGD